MEENSWSQYPMGWRFKFKSSRSRACVWRVLLLGNSLMEALFLRPHESASRECRGANNP